MVGRLHSFYHFVDHSLKGGVFGEIHSEEIERLLYFEVFINLKHFRAFRYQLHFYFLQIYILFLVINELSDPKRKIFPLSDNTLLANLHHFKYFAIIQEKDAFVRPHYFRHFILIPFNLDASQLKLMIHYFLTAVVLIGLEVELAFKKSGTFVKV